MRGMGRVFRGEPGWWIAYCHHGKEYRESARSEKEGDAKRLLQRRLTSRIMLSGVSDL
jgi:hypothetical protein